MKLSAVIPSWKDPYLAKTVQSILDNADCDVEVIVVYDGYWPTVGLPDDKRVIQLHLGKNRGMRGAINAGVLVSTGDFIMRTDEHCMFAKGFGKILTEQCEPNWIVTARRYFLDPIKWEAMDLQPVEHEKLVIQEGKKFSGQPWRTRDEQQKDVAISETMAMQGSFWIMPRKWWNEVIGELQTEGYGPLIQDSHEMVFKTWKAGGKLMLNKNTWFAHRHRDFGRTHQMGTKENPANCDDGYAYALKVWKEYYDNEIRPRWKL